METHRHRCVVKYQIATYSGEEIVFCDSDSETEHIIAKCKRQLSRGIPLPFGSESFKVVEREYYDGE